MKVIEDLRQRSELEVVQLDVLPGRELSLAAAVQVRDLADCPQVRRRGAPPGELDPEHEGADFGLVVIQAPPLEADHVLLRHALVPGRDQRGQLVEDSERALVAFDPLDRVALVDQLPVRLRLRGATR